MSVRREEGSGDDHSLHATASAAHELDERTGRSEPGRSVGGRRRILANHSFLSPNHRWLTQHRLLPHGGTPTVQRRQRDQEAHHADDGEDPADELQVDAGQVDVDGKRQGMSPSAMRKMLAPMPMPPLTLSVRRPCGITARVGVACPLS